MESKNELRRSYFNSVSTIVAKDWNTVNNNQNIYLSLPYLQAIESALNHEMEFRYILFYDKNNKPVGIAVAQLVQFIDKGSEYYGHLCKFSNQIKNKIVQSLNIKVLVCGNVFACGENGFVFSNELTDEQVYNNLQKGLNELSKSDNIKKQTSLILFKEFWQSNTTKSDLLKQHHYHDFMIDVNMVLTIKKDWNALDIYLANMVAKFRTKANSVLKKSTPLIKKDMDLVAIIQHKDRIEELYNMVLSKSDFSIGVLNAQAFINLKEQLGYQFILNGYFLDDELIGFSSAFWFNNIIDANYVGIDYQYNVEYSTYQRMLYDFVGIAIEKNATEIRYGRTAEEIKSCLGAKPVSMKLYIKHKNSVSNKLLKALIKTITPTKYEIRKPFKAAVV